MNLLTLIAAMSLVGDGRGLLGKGLVPTGGPPGTNLNKKIEKKKNHSWFKSYWIVIQCLIILSLNWELICTSPSQYLSLLLPQRILCNMYVVVQFYPWLKFYFPLFQTHYHTLRYPTTKENKIWTKDKIEPQHTQWISLSIFITCWVDNDLKLWGVTVFQITSAHSYKELTNKEME